MATAKVAAPVACIICGGQGVTRQGRPCVAGCRRPGNPFGTPELAAMYAKCLELASDNFSEFYYGDGRTDLGPRNMRTGAGHRCAFWDGARGRRSLYDGTRGGKKTYGYAAFRAGVDFAKGKRA